MKIIIEEPLPGEEDQIIVRCGEMSPGLLQMLSRIKTEDILVIAYEQERIHRLKPSEIYYFEALENKVFAYTKGKIFESRQKLYEIEEMLGNGDFFRASKSVVLNLRKIQYLSPAFNGRFEAALDNGEKVIVSRQYVPELKKKLRI